MSKRSKWGILVTALILLAAVGVFLFASGRRQEPVTLQITALSETGRGIDPAGGFEVTASSALKEAELRAMLVMEPEIGSYTLSGSGKVWTLTPDTPLSKNAVYRFRALDGEGGALQSFAFQTESDLQVTSVYPSYWGWEEISQNTGIELTLNAADVDAKAFFEIQPETEGTLETKGYRVIFQPAKPLEPDYTYRVTLRRG